MKKIAGLVAVMTAMSGGMLFAEIHNTQIMREQSNRVNEPIAAPIGEITCDVNGSQRTVKTAEECKVLYGTVVELPQASISNKRVSNN